MDKVTRRDTSMETALKFSSLYQKLKNKGTLKHLWASVYLLHALSQSDTHVGGGHGSGRGSAAALLRAELEESNMYSVGLERLPDPRKRREGYSAPDTYVPREAATSPAEQFKGKDAADRTIHHSTATLEHLLIRDLVYVFQGIDGMYIKQSGDNIHISDDVKLNKSQRGIVGKLAEMGCLYKKVAEFVEGCKEEGEGGTMRQALASSLSRELTSYYRLIAILQRQINPSNTVYNPGSVITTTTTSPDTSKTIALTLKRLYVWVLDPLRRLRVMATVVRSARDKKGGMLLSVLHTLAQHGDPFVEGFVRGLMDEVATPFFTLLRKWVYEGDLTDPYGEFFVTERGDVGLEDFWEGRYVLREEMVPNFVGEAGVGTIFVLGKTINFIRHACKDTQFVLSKNTCACRTATTTITQKCPPTCTPLFTYTSLLTRLLPTHISHLYAQANKHALYLLINTFGLKQHLANVNGYLLLEEGDWAGRLAEVLAGALGRRAGGVGVHELRQGLETSLSGRRVNEDGRVRVGVRMLEISPGDLTWDVFSITYTVTPPLTTILHKAAMEKYTRLSCFLWKLKRVEGAVSGDWKARMRLAGRMRGRGDRRGPRGDRDSRISRTEPRSHRSEPRASERGSVAERGARGEGDVVGSHWDDTKREDLDALLHSCLLVWMKMCHVVTQVRYFVCFEVITSSILGTSSTS
ncbi:Spc98 family-domain-containing protein [Fimicolochytrium jonesii]|uniref:Spc98 family-domain-containing protein n=1 Tax=Fimicolochytrium jonesii TaxID=1396493 RepID=UPI0022FF153D|nr:Spc98 family-domain-containing protein [Fimicolochytrium jonesii]KAI8817814.1 Spc98 family-domain-containing protein [Fimicolochytrium jonesii]